MLYTLIDVSIFTLVNKNFRFSVFVLGLQRDIYVKNRGRCPNSHIASLVYWERSVANQGRIHIAGIRRHQVNIFLNVVISGCMYGDRVLFASQPGKWKLSASVCDGLTCQSSANAFNSNQNIRRRHVGFGIPHLSVYLEREILRQSLTGNCDKAASDSHCREYNAKAIWITHFYLRDTH